MRKLKNKYYDILYLLFRLVNPIFNPLKLIRGIPRYFGFFRDLINYSRLHRKEPIRIIDIYPCIHEKTQTQIYDSHYFYQDIWAFRRIYESKVDNHIDVGSRIIFIGLLTSITKVTYIDIRPVEVTLANFESKQGNILSLPFEDNSVKSLSCLHVAEHIGLGRYSDSLDPLGTELATKELERVICEGGNLYFSLPVGKPRLCFNAHRIHSPQQIMRYFSNLKLIEFSGIDDEGGFQRNIDISTLNNANYACGLFWFRKEDQRARAVRNRIDVESP